MVYEFGHKEGSAAELETRMLQIKELVVSTSVSLIQSFIMLVQDEPRTATRKMFCSAQLQT